MKRPAADYCRVSGDNVECFYLVEVRNVGNNRAPIMGGAVYVEESFPPDATLTTTAEWTCNPAGAGKASCFLVGPSGPQYANLEPGGSRTMSVTLRMSAAAAKASGCRVTNRARITLPAAGNAYNVNGANDASEYTAIVPASVCPQPVAPAIAVPPPPVACPPGYVMSGGRCQERIGQGSDALTPAPPPPLPAPQVARCPRGTVGTPPNCVRPQPAPPPPPPRIETCPRGTIGTPPNCVRPQPAPPPPPPRIETCPRGTVGTPPNCVRPRPAPPPPPPRIETCPRGTVGTPPNCVRPQPAPLPPRVCPRGTTGTPPNCVPVEQERRRCPERWVGTPPRCVRVQRPEPPRPAPPAPRPQGQCPPGQIGYPRCFTPQKPQTPQPAPTTTRPPRPTPRECPAGTERNKDGRCVTILR